ncbi:MAG: transporter permease [Pseudomonas sp.]|jgi:multiple sugar transport system permease protein|uniref:carbohydrate ABC transporter permease n=1 Tax=Pseudomonas sp. TaxID=306 RepID=UPI00261841D0|nr:carbohydrate ABC transporter permease [Pseudomonas sp.]MDB6052059.1 transporter permease [Pseudomonas sp.]
MATVIADNVAVKQAIAKPRRRVNGWHLVGLLAIFLFAIFPFYWMVATSMKTQAEALTSPPIWLFTPRLDNYVQVLFHRDVLSSLANSLIVAACTTALAVGLGTPAAYALARFEFKGKEDLWFWFITNRMLSPIVVALPIFLMARTLGLIDTRLVLILVYLTFNLPIVVWICTDQFRGVPKDLDEAARLSGASRFTIFWRIALPLAMPGVAVSAIFSFIFSWNELLYALVLTRNVARTAPVTATSFMSGYDLPWGEIMATGTLIVFPVIIFALMVSKHLVQGLTMGAVK